MFIYEFKSLKVLIYNILYYKVTVKTSLNAKNN